jgi:hypothetical protein
MSRKAIIIFLVITSMGCVVVEKPEPDPVITTDERFVWGCVVVEKPEPDPVITTDERFVCYYDCGFEEVCCYPAHFRESVDGVCYPLTRRETEDYCY